MANKLLLSLSLLLSIVTIISITAVHSRSLLDSTPPSDLISDGVHTHHRNSSPQYLILNHFSGAESTCEQTYGFLPCTTTVLGNLFLIIVYGYLMFVSATYLSGGSELLLEILGPGVVGGLFLPMLGALPDAILILVSGLSGTKAVAQDQVSVGMGLIAGSTVLSITIIWGSCVVVGKCDLHDSIAIDGRDTKGFHLTDSGVSTDIWTCYAARIMTISVIPFIVVQLPQLLNSNSGRHLAVLIALILSISMLVAYCAYQVFQPWIQKRRLEYAKYKHVISGILKHLRQRALGRLLNDGGEPNYEVIRKLFEAIDENKDGRLSAGELKALIIGIRFDEIDLDQDDAVNKVLQDFDSSNDSFLSFDEFVNGILQWLDVATRNGAASAGDAGPQTIKLLNDYHKKTKKEHDLLEPEEPSDETAEGVDNPKWTSFKAVMMLLVGTIIAAAFADPLVDVVDNFSDATSIPSFFISFVVLPLATSSEAVSAIIFARRKKKRTASLAFSALYGAVTMNNVLCLSVFLALVYVRGLTWDFSSEVLVILIVCIVMGGFASFRTTFPLWTCGVAYILYPFSLALAYVLNYVIGWS